LGKDIPMDVMTRTVEKFKDSFYSQVPPATVKEGIIFVDVDKRHIELWKLSTGKKSYAVEYDGKQYEFVKQLNAAKGKGGRKPKAA
jgi:hypothetical protein